MVGRRGGILGQHCATRIMSIFAFPLYWSLFITIKILQRPSSRKLRQSCFQQVDHILPCKPILIHILKSYKTMMLILVLTNQTVFDNKTLPPSWTTCTTSTTLSTPTSTARGADVNADEHCQQILDEVVPGNDIYLYFRTDWLHPCRKYLREFMRTELDIEHWWQLLFSAWKVSWTRTWLREVKSFVEDLPISPFLWSEVSFIKFCNFQRCSSNTPLEQIKFFCPFFYFSTAHPIFSVSSCVFLQELSLAGPACKIKRSDCKLKMKVEKEHGF